MHPGSYRGLTREQGLEGAAEAIERAGDGLGLWNHGLRVLIENTAGSEFSLGGNFEQVAELVHHLRKHVPVGACIDTCHTHVAGYDIVSNDGFAQTLQHLDQTVGLGNVHVFHCNDAKAACGSKLDRHQHIGKGTIGLEPFRRLLNDPRLAHAAFIAETPIDEPLDDLMNVNALKSLVGKHLATNKGKSQKALQTETKPVPPGGTAEDSPALPALGERVLLSTEVPEVRQRQRCAHICFVVPGLIFAPFLVISMPRLSYANC